MDTRFLDTEQAAAALGLSPRCLEKWRVVGAGPRFKKFGRHIVRYAASDLAEFAEAATRTSTSDRGPAKTARSSR